MDRYFSQEHHSIDTTSTDTLSTDTTVSMLFIFSSIYIRTANISYIKKDIFHLAPYTKFLLCPHPISTPTQHSPPSPTLLHPQTIRKCRSHKKFLFTLTKIINNWLGEEGTLGVAAL